MGAIEQQSPKPANNRIVAMFAARRYAASDPDEYASLIRGGRVEVIVSQRGSFDANVTRVDLGELWMQSGRENLPRTFRTVVAADRAFLVFLACPQPPMNILSTPIEHNDLVLIRPGEALSSRSVGPCEWAGMSLPKEQFHRFGAILTGKEILPQDVKQVLRPLQPRLARLRRLHRAAVDLAETAPEAVSHPDAAHGLQQHLIEAAFSAASGADDPVSVPGHRRQRIMARFETLIESNPDRALFLTEVCEAIGVTERTFRNCCQRDLGMSPTRYLTLRRLHQVRCSLCMAEPANTVTEIATRYGFWELGRFSMAYHELFQESPSDTLRRSRQNRPRRVEISESALRNRLLDPPIK